MRIGRTTWVTVALAALVTLVGCGGGQPGGPTASAPATTGSGTNSPAATSPPGGPSAPGGAPGGAPTSQLAKVSANTASESQIATALRDAGVPNAERWAKEVVEYRPYPADDRSLTKLREELAKYNPGQDTIDKIISVLQP
ncbi:hypothetical protein [Streptosporangium sandarakinum]|uniref:Uncharacterized protein n=1 Tax=Streptosporangium sandarakinum TaxID=1260955 RepID=A0A852V4E0_9ACTN|nr:hypothetical protein [Streptosporangium sandarakinum]NYF40775.1 hypothetical protein [Streptosporangium sandarakinum]